MDKELLDHMNQNRITATSDGLLRDLIIRGLYRQAHIACVESIARRNREIESLGRIKGMIERKFEGEEKR